MSIVWQCELYEMRNSKCWRAFVDMTMHKIKFPLVVLVQQEMANNSEGGSSMSHVVCASEVVAEIEWPHENAIAEEHKVQPVVHEQVQHEVEDGVEEFGGEMNADQGELDERIVDQMELDDEEHRTFVGGRDGRFFENESTIPKDWGNVEMDVLTVSDGYC